MDLNLPPDDEVEGEADMSNLENEIHAEVTEDYNEVEDRPDRQESGVDIYRRERQARRAMMKRKREQEGAGEKSNKVQRPAPVAEVKINVPRDARGFGSIPEGWIDCPQYGKPIGRFIPSKVPLDDNHNGLLEPGKRYSLKHLFHQQRAAKRDVAVIIDLTFTTRYYSPVEADKAGVKHLKIKCRGRNEVPDGESVNTFVYEANRYLSMKENSYILVHCTHGFNRTGYMIINYLVRYQGYSVDQAVKAFAAARPPGIYKKDYIQSLYSLYHERLSEPLVVPSTPEWKRPLDLNADAGDDDDVDDAVIVKQNAPMTIDDVLGDPIPEDQQQELQRRCMRMLDLVTNPNHRQFSFPGSNPVSLDRKQFQLLRQRYYYVTWKADGTRYMMLILSDGCYLIDRKFNFRRVQMRFPQRARLAYQQDFTLLDGEMVIDSDTGTLSRRYLVYDLLVVNSKKVFQLPFSTRWSLIDLEVVGPRRSDAKQNRRYNYDDELFRVRRKDFWVLNSSQSVLEKFIPKLPHGSDGLIFQGWDDPYVFRTHQGLLKWKFTHMNSVDFLLKRAPDNTYCLLLQDRGNHRMLEGASVTFGPDVDPVTLEGKVIECAWNNDSQVWEFMRERPDKDYANAFNTYQKVKASINDNITKDVLLAEVQEILKLPMYKERISRDIEKSEARRPPP